MLTKFCAKCGKMIPFGKPLCSTCAAKNGDRHRMYDAKVRDKRASAFYHSAQWCAVRDIVMQRDGYQCQRCKANGLVRPAEEVHHIYPLRLRWNKRLDVNNLVSLCHHCHMEVERGDPGEWKKV